MEITQDQFTANMNGMPQEAQVQVIEIIENNEPPALQAFAASLGVTLSMGEEPMPQEQPSVLDEVMAEEPVAPEEPAPVEAPLPEQSPMQDQMQQLALGDQVAGMIDQPGAEDQTGVADDVPMNAREGAYIVNAAAIAKVGKKDFEERIIEPAIEYLREKEGIEIDKANITRPAQQVNGEQKILASNKEYHIPPELAEVIGTDLLDKINKRGEAETEKKLEEQEQQPQQQQQQQDFAQKEVPVRAAKGTQVSKKKAKAPTRDEEIARTLVAEAGVFKNKEAMQKVLNVMFNRMADPNFRDEKGKEVKNLEDNLNPTQFNGFKTQKTKKLDENQVKIARGLVESARQGKLKDLTKGSTYFWNPNTSTSSWFKDNIANNTKYEISTSDKVPNTAYQHLFYRLRPRVPNSPPEGRTPLALEEAPPAQQTQRDITQITPERLNSSFLAASPDQHPRLRTPPAATR